MDRSPVVAGQFYPGTKAQWEPLVRRYLGEQGTRESAILVMLPHAGYVYSGAIAGETLAGVSMPETVLLLGPNHTGLGSPLSLWPSGRWLLPGAHLDVDESLARMILSTVSAIQADQHAHLREHSLEVILPFVWAIHPGARIVPLAVAEQRPEVLMAASSGLAEVLKQWPKPVLIIVSSDMSHFLPADEAKSRDSLALQAILDRSPDNLLATVRARNISMCGVLPMTMGLAVANILGAKTARLVRYGSSGDESGDYSQVVGYAGVVVG